MEAVSSEQKTQGTVAPVREQDWWRGAVIYQIYPRSFQDSNGDGIGDLRGITSRLGYVADLGVDAIWLSPIFTSPMKDFGYDVSDYCDIDPIFGTLADFDAMVAEAHRLGLKVIIDQVLSHTSDQHPWFVESRSSRTNPKADWYVWVDPQPDGTPPNNWLSVFGGSAWTWDTRRCQYYLHNFLEEQPDLNFYNPDVQAALLETVKFWLDRGVDGFRLDTVNFYFHDRQLRSNPPAPEDEDQSLVARTNPYAFQDHVYDKNRPDNLQFLGRFRALLDRYPGATSVGEVGEGGRRSLELVAEYTSGNDKLHKCYTFDFLGENFSRDFFRQTVERFESIAEAGWACWAFSNHDVIRHVSRWQPHTTDPARLAKLMASVLLSLRGSVCLYQGEELALPEAELAFEDLVDPPGIRFWPEYKGRDGCRTPMVWESGAPFGGFSKVKPWLPVPEEHLQLAVDHQFGVESSVQAHYSRFLAFRRREPIVRRGHITFLDGPEHILAFRRELNGKAILCVFNLGEDDARYDLPAGAKVNPIEGLGFTGRLADNRIVLGGQDAFFGRIG
jgi:alpha-glucosidase